MVIRKSVHIFLCSPGRCMAEATAETDFTPIITIDILVQAGRYPIDLKQRHLENAFVCPCIFLLFFSIIVIIWKSSSSSSSSSGHPHYRHHQGHHHHFITGKVKASDSPCFSAEFVHCQNKAQHRRSAVHQQQLS